jgi:hypothetical protein
MPKNGNPKREFYNQAHEPFLHSLSKIIVGDFIAGLPRD